MMKSMVVLIGATLTLSSVACDGPGPADVQRPEVDVLDVNLVSAPMPFAAEGQIHLVYEVEVFNPPGNSPVRLESVAIAEGSRAVQRYESGELQGMLSTPELNLGPADGRLVYLWLSFAPESLPDAVTTEIAFAGTEETRDVAIEIPEHHPVPVEAPLSGAGWVALGVGNDAPHRRQPYGTPGAVSLAQRFAVDFARVDEDLNLFVGDERENRSYLGYGEPVLAVAPARVVHVRDGIPDNVPGSLAIEITPQTVGGNTVTLELADGTDVYNAHLIPGSIRVEVGDAVQAGDTLGLVGNSGNSDFPHLHIHFADVHDYDLGALEADGMPYLLESFEILGNRPVVGMRYGEMPLNEAIVRFN